ncbi:MAG TPA: OmpA family protein [Cyclobacteriaceae bacterium]|nr:OmpA family protein [Cyclobacteriaceae bacterium]
MSLTKIGFSFVLLTGVASYADAQITQEYAKYDFVAGEKILFEDNFTADKPGSVPQHWKLSGGGATVAHEEAGNFVSITQYYTILAPKMKTPAYLPEAFTLEFDYWLDAGYEGNPGVFIALLNAAGQDATITPDKSSTSLFYNGNNVAGEHPGEVKDDNFYNKWLHIAIAVRDKQIKVYIDEHQVLAVPDFNFKAASLQFKGNSSSNMPMYFKNVRLAEGGGMNLIAKALATGKFITHGIRFDTGKSNLRPESMGVLREVAGYLQANPAIKFEVSGHTDSDGDDASNLTLSEARAAEVKKQLLSMGVADNQLSTKGYGETKPIDSNLTQEGKANNRRVEFVKQ